MLLQKITTQSLNSAYLKRLMMGRIHDDVEPIRGSVILHDGFEISFHSIGDADKPLLLLIIGGSGIGSFFYRVAKGLSRHFRCVYYDKRGFVPRHSDPTSVAKLKNEVVSVEKQADDAAESIRYFSPDRPAYVLGTSCGGVEALDLVVRYPELVRMAILHEPITISVVREDDVRNTMLEVHRQVGKATDMWKGLTDFRAYWTMAVNSIHAATSQTERPALKDEPEKDEELVSPPRPESEQDTIELYNSRGNVCEAVAMADYTVNEEGARAVSNKILIIAGQESIKLRVSMPAAALASIFGDENPLKILPGDHTSFASERLAPRFCEELLLALREKEKVVTADQQQRARM